MQTFQDFEKDKTPSGLLKLIQQHRASDEFKTALLADAYDRQQNKTISDYTQVLYTMSGSKVSDFTASNFKLCSNFFHRLNTQRCMYSLGAGVSFIDPLGEDVTDELKVDTTKQKLGKTFDHDLKTAAYYALIHGASFCFWNLDRMHVFKLTEFVPLYDEQTSALRAGIRFWQLKHNSPLYATLYEEDGYTQYRQDQGRKLEIIEEKRAYKENIRYTPADGMEVIGGENYSRLPIVPMFGSALKQSTLIGMQQSIDAYDLIHSGFANDIQDCSIVYWIVSGAGGMTDKDLSRFRDRLKFNHMAVSDDEEMRIQPYTQDVPTVARSEFLAGIRAQIYEDFGGLDVHTIAAGATNDHIDAAYQPLDEEAADFEYHISMAIQQLLTLLGIKDKPIFRRIRISNQKEQADMVLAEAQWLDQETVLRKLPNISPEEVYEIMRRQIAEEQQRLTGGENEVQSSATIITE